MFQKKKMQQIQYYAHEHCFAHENDADQYHQLKFYRNQKTFNLEPMEDVILVLTNCGANWFRQGVLHDMVYVNGRFEFAKTSSKQLCLYIRNYSDQACIHVEAGSQMSSLLNRPEIIYKMTSIPRDFLCPSPQVDVEIDAGWTSNAENVVDESDISEILHIRIGKTF